MRIAEAQKPPPGCLFLDHVSHFVSDIDAAARLLESLGFVVTPLSAQYASGKPVGTSNRCVMLDEGYIEILTPTERTPGIYLACFGTPDADFEHRRLAEHGFQPQPIVELSRPLETGGTVRFRVVRPLPESMPERRIQFVQQMTPEQIWRPEVLAHRNGVTALRAIHICTTDISGTAARWSRFTGLLPFPLETARGDISFRSSDTKKPFIAGYGLKCKDPEAFAQRCRAAGLRVEGYTVTLPPFLGGKWEIT